MFLLSVVFTAIPIWGCQELCSVLRPVAGVLCFTEEETEAWHLRVLPGLRLEWKPPDTNLGALIGWVLEWQIYTKLNIESSEVGTSSCVSHLCGPHWGFYWVLSLGQLFHIMFFTHCVFKSWFSRAVASFVTHTFLLPVTGTYAHTEAQSAIGLIVLIQPAHGHDFMFTVFKCLFLFNGLECSPILDDVR